MKKNLFIVLVLAMIFGIPTYAREDDTTEIFSENGGDDKAIVSPVTQKKPYIEMDYNLDIVSKEDWENTSIGEYPIDVLSSKWNTLSYSEAAAACNMPIEYARTLTTDELVSYALNYPFLMDMWAYDNIADGMNHLENKSGVFAELFSRADCYDKLLKEYINMEVDYAEVAETKDVRVLNYDSELFIEVFMGLNYDLLSEEQVEIFVEEYGKNFSDRNVEFQDSAFSTVFYGAVQEKKGMIPAEAIPESVAEYFDSTEACNHSRAIDAYTCNDCGALLEYTQITVNGKSVNCFRWLAGGMTADDITFTDNYVATSFPTYKKLRSASSKYNCHSYAWYSTSTSNVYTIEDPKSIYNNTNYWTLWQPPMRTIKSGDRITFWAGQALKHSAIVTSSARCTSKMGHWGVYNTSISEMTSFYGASSTKAYIP